MSKIKCQKSNVNQVNFCWSVPPELLRSFFHLSSWAYFQSCNLKPELTAGWLDGLQAEQNNISTSSCHVVYRINFDILCNFFFSGARYRNLFRYVLYISGQIFWHLILTSMCQTVSCWGKLRAELQTKAGFALTCTVFVPPHDPTPKVSRWVRAAYLICER